MVKKLEPRANLGTEWLEDILEHAEINMRASYDRSSCWPNKTLQGQFPIGWEEAEKLFVRLSQRFESWTGRSIEDHIKARPKDG